MPRIPGNYVDSDEYSSSSSSSSSESDSDSIPIEPKVDTSQSPPAASNSASPSTKEKPLTLHATSNSAPTLKIEESSGCLAKCSITNKLKSTFTCVICTDLYKDPYTLQCGHSFCFDCVYSWLSRKKQCPQCRSRIFRRPSRSFAIKEAIVCLLKADGKHHNEYSTQHSDMWDGLFGKDMTGGVIADTDDGIRRCANCAWEVVGNQCENCGMQFDPDDFDRGDDSYSLEAGSGVSSEDEYGFDEVYDDMNDDEEDTDLEGFVVGDDEIEIDEAASDWLDEVSDDDVVDYTDEFLDYTDEVALGLRPSLRLNPITELWSANLSDDSLNDNGDLNDDWRSDSPHDTSDTPSSSPTEMRFSDDENDFSNSAANASVDVSLPTASSVALELSRDGSWRGQSGTLQTANANPESDGPSRKRGRQILSDSDSDSDSAVVRHNTSKRPRVARISDGSGSDDSLDKPERSSSSIVAGGSTGPLNFVTHDLPALSKPPSTSCDAAVSSMIPISMAQNNSPHSKHTSPSTTKHPPSSHQGVPNNVGSQSLDHRKGMSIIAAGDPAHMLNETVCRSKRKGKEKEIVSVQTGGTDGSDTTGCGEDEVVPSAVIDASLMHQKKNSKKKRRKKRKLLHDECSPVSSHAVGTQSVAASNSATFNTDSNPDRPLKSQPSSPVMATDIMEDQDSKLISKQSMNNLIKSSDASSSASVPTNSAANKPECIQIGDSDPDETARKSKKKGKRSKKHKRKGKGKEKLEI